MIEIAPTMKRLVFEDAVAGVSRLCGEALSNDLPFTAGPFNADGRVVPFISLVRVTKHCAFYREPLVPKSYTSMHPEQR